MLRMLTTHALVCDGDGCDASFVPSGHHDVTARIDSVILSDAVHALREAEAVGWRHDHAIGATRANLCPRCAADLAAREKTRQTTGGEQLALNSEDPK